MGSVAQVDQDCIDVGVDTHLDSHTAAVKNSRGATVAKGQFPACEAGYQALLNWASLYGQINAFGIEGTGSYGAGLSRFLTARGYRVVEVIRPKRQNRRYKGKSDPVDAEAAARSVQAGEAQGQPKAGDGPVEVIRMLKVVRTSANHNRTQAINQMRSFIVVAPEELRQELRGLKKRKLIKACASLRGDASSVASCTRFSLGMLGRRIQALEEEIAVLDVDIKALVAAIAPSLVERPGVGPQSAATLLITFGDNADRLSSEAAFAKISGTAPLEASSGSVQRHRLNRGGDRQANSALYTIVVTRMRSHGPTVDYVKRRTQEGKTKKEIIRCLKRYVAREIYAVLCPKTPEPATVTT